MNYLKENPVGIEKVIDTIQKRIYDPLIEKWGTLDIHPKTEKRVKDEGVILEAYIGKKEYKPILYSEGNKIFFVEGNSPTLNNGVATNDLWAICILKIGDIYDTDFIESESAHLDLLDAIYDVVGVESVLGLEYGMSNLKRVVEDVFQYGNFKYSDIHPYHVFMVKMSVDYLLIKNKC